MYKVCISSARAKLKGPVRLVSLPSMTEGGTPGEVSALLPSPTMWTGSVSLRAESKLILKTLWLETS
jgi:hypothetical protein